MKKGRGAAAERQAVPASIPGSSYARRAPRPVFVIICALS
ncbi:hypothetical protein CLOSTHATH_07182 [Hungatella hathewayi DSM 13479]|uniref:Uncharacterized protein n=1 Tax=Hungatella hathewayi DSM 13479 TaxID=566550 RepID=D3AU68_9FIRM|nr:hypothetical protein CLOSTHATH_07182 [Hungatella hathewayi DSM 13479]